jgi:glycosyltransferase involved in cell wall biosynthesis
MKKNILHVVTISFSIPIFFRGQFSYFKNSQNTFVACQDSEELHSYSLDYGFSPLPFTITRKISPLIDLISIVQLLKLIKRNKIDIVVGHTPKGALVSMISSYIMRVPVRIYFKHGLVFESAKGVKRFLLILVERLTVRLATKVICVSNSVLAKSKILNLGGDKKQLVIKHGSCNGIDVINKFNPDKLVLQKRVQYTDKLGFVKSDFIIGFIGRLANDKGIRELIQAFNLLKSTNEKYKLLLIGPIDSRDSLDLEFQKLIQNSNGIIRLEFQDDIEYYYSLMDVFVLPSYREGLPTVVLEASAMKVPVITTKNTGCVDSILENQTGIYTTLSINDIVNKILYFEEKSIRSDFGMKGRNFVMGNFNQQDFWEALRLYY